MNNQDLKTIFHIQKVLTENKYTDVQRLAQKILQYSKVKHIPLKRVFKRISKNEPLEYIFREAEFCGNQFYVDKNVLIPRIETEELVVLGIKEIQDTSPALVLDIGTGSGAVILSLAEYFKDTGILFIGSDISRKALKVARKNKRRLGVENCTFVHSNMLENISLENNYILLANLPYIPTDEYLNLDPSVKEYEPKIALDGGKDGQDIFKQLFTQVKDRKEKPESILLECHSTKIEETKDITVQHFPDSKVEIIKDCFNRKRFLKISF